MWLARTIIFHDCTEGAPDKTDRRLWRHIPPHKTLFGAENRRGLPIGNLTSQFFSNVYLNELDQFVKHHLKAHHYLRYSDDFVLAHEDQAQLLAWRAQIQAFLAERLRLCLTDPLAKPRLIGAGPAWIMAHMIAGDAGNSSRADRETEDRAWLGGVKPRALAAFWQTMAGVLGRNGQLWMP